MIKGQLHPEFSLFMAEMSFVETCYVIDEKIKEFSCLCAQLLRNNFYLAKILFILIWILQLMKNQKIQKRHIGIYKIIS